MNAVHFEVSGSIEKRRTMKNRKFAKKIVIAKKVKLHVQGCFFLLKRPTLNENENEIANSFSFETIFFIVF